MPASNLPGDLDFDMIIENYDDRIERLEEIIGNMPAQEDAPEAARLAALEMAVAQHDAEIAGLRNDKVNELYGTADRHAEIQDPWGDATDTASKTRSVEEDPSQAWHRLWHFDSGAPMVQLLSEDFGSGAGKYLALVRYEQDIDELRYADLSSFVDTGDLAAAIDTEYPFQLIYHSALALNVRNGWWTRRGHKTVWNTGGVGDVAFEPGVDAAGTWYAYLQLGESAGREKALFPTTMMVYKLIQADYDALPTDSKNTRCLIGEIEWNGAVITDWKNKWKGGYKDDGQEVPDGNYAGDAYQLRTLQWSAGTTGYEDAVETLRLFGSEETPASQYRMPYLPKDATGAGDLSWLVPDADLTSTTSKTVERHTGAGSVETLQLYGVDAALDEHVPVIDIAGAVRSVKYTYIVLGETSPHLGSSRDYTYIRDLTNVGSDTFGFPVRIKLALLDGYLQVEDGRLNIAPQPGGEVWWYGNIDTDSRPPYRWVPHNWLEWPEYNPATGDPGLNDVRSDASSNRDQDFRYAQLGESEEWAYFKAIGGQSGVRVSETPLSPDAVKLIDLHNGLSVIGHLLDADGREKVDWIDGLLNDGQAAPGKKSLDWVNRQQTDTGELLAHDWAARKLYDANVASLDYGAHQLCGDTGDEWIVAAEVNFRCANLDEATDKETGCATFDGGIGVYGTTYAENFQRPNGTVTANKWTNAEMLVNVTDGITFRTDHADDGDITLNAGDNIVLNPVGDIWYGTDTGATTAYRFELRDITTGAVFRFRVTKGGVIPTT